MLSQLILLLSIISLTTISFAQDISGNLEGILTDSLGNPLPGVNITVQSDNLQGLKVRLQTRKDISETSTFLLAVTK